MTNGDVSSELDWTLVDGVCVPIAGQTTAAAANQVCEEFYPTRVEALERVAPIVWGAFNGD
jgi:hypothetical protein